MLTAIKREDLISNFREIQWIQKSFSNYLKENKTNKKMKRLVKDFFSSPRISKMDELYANIYFFNRVVKVFLRKCHSTMSRLSSDNEMKNCTYNPCDLLKISRQIIFDFYDLNNRSGGLFTSDHISSNDKQWGSMFYHKASHLGLSTYKNIADINNIDFDISLTPILIRMSYEAKVKELIKYKCSYKEDRRKDLTISQLLNFFNDDNEYSFLKKHVDLNYILSINTWANNYIHTCKMPYYCKMLVALYIIKPLFKVESKEGFNLKGISVIVDYEKLSKKLSIKYDRNVTLGD